MAEADPAKAIDIIKAGSTVDIGDDFEDSGRDASSLQPGQFTRTWPVLPENHIRA